MIEYFKSKKKLQKELDEAIDAIQYLHTVINKLEKLVNNRVSDQEMLRAERKVLKTEVEGLQAELNAVKNKYPTKLEKYIEAYCLEKLEQLVVKGEDTPNYSRMKTQGARDAYSIILSMIRKSRCGT